MENPNGNHQLTVMSRRTLRTIVAVAGALALVGSHALLPVGLARAQAGQLAAAKAQALTQGTVVEREPGAEERHSFSIDLAAGEFLHVVIDQRGADVTAFLFAPDSTPLITADSPNGRRGPERIAWVAATAGKYRLDVANAPGPAASQGRYQLTVVAQRPATPADAAHARAERLFAEAEPLRRINTAVSRASARDRYLAALDIFSDRGLSYEQGLCLFNVGILHLRAGEAREAIPYLTRARPLFNPTTDSMYASVINALGGALDIIGDPEAAMAHYRETLSLIIGAADRALEAIVRNNIGKLYADMADWQRALEEYRQALVLFQQLGDRRREALALYNIGVSYTSTGDLKRGVEYLQQSLTIRRAIATRQAKRRR